MWANRRCWVVGRRPWLLCWHLWELAVRRVEVPELVSVPVRQQQGAEPQVR